MNAKMKRVAERVIDSILEDEEFCSVFCSGCPAIPCDMLEECPAGWRACEPECYRITRWRNIEKEVYDALSI